MYNFFGGLCRGNIGFLERYANSKLMIAKFKNKKDTTKECERNTHQLIVTVTCLIARNHESAFKSIVLSELRPSHKLYGSSIYFFVFLLLLLLPVLV